MIQYPKIKPVRLFGKAKTEFRRKTGKTAKEVCQTCGRFAPIKHPIFGYNLKYVGHLSHIKSYGAGGGDTSDNVKWECWYCHIEIKHGPRWSVK